MHDEQNPLSLEERVRLTRIRTFFSNGAGNPFAIMAGGIVFALFLYDYGVPQRTLLLWVIPICLFGVSIFAFEYYVHRVGIAPHNAQFFLQVRSVLGGLASALFGVTIAFLPESEGGAPYFFAFIVCSTLVTVCYMAYATVFSYCLMINAVTVLPYIVFYFYRYFLHGDVITLLLGVTAVIWQIIVLVKALRVSRYAVGEITSGEHLRDEMVERRHAEQALRASQEELLRLASMLRLICDNVPDMIWAKDLDNRYVFVNKSFSEKLLGLKGTDEPLGKTYNFYRQREQEQHPGDTDWHTFGQYAEDVDHYTLSRDEPTIFEESGNVRGKFVFLDIHQSRFVDAQGEVIGTVGCARDITERKASEAFVHHLAHHDVLTDLPNRLMLTDRLRQALAQARRDRSKLAVLFVDLDRLKPVNDSLGHDVGDLLLKEVAVRLCSVVARDEDTVSRLGGDEFVILLPRLIREHDAAMIAERVLNTLSESFLIGPHRIDISASIGVAVYPQHGEDVNVLMKNADTAMYSAKRNGRNGFQFFG